MARAAQMQIALRQRRGDAVEPVAELGLGKNEIQLHQHVKIAGDILPVRGAVRRQLHEDAINLNFLLRAQLPQLVVGLHRRHRLDEQRRAGTGHIVHQARNRALVLGLHRHDVALRAHGDDRLLQRFGIARGGNDLLQRVVHARGRGADQPADGRKLAGRGVGDLVLAGDGAGDLVLQKAVGLQGVEQIVDAAFLLPVGGAVGAHIARRLQHARDLQQLARVEHATHVRALQRCAHVLHAGKRRAALDDHHRRRGGRLVQALFHLGAVAGGTQRAGGIPRGGAHRLGGQQVQNRRKLQRFQGFFILFHPMPFTFFQ